MANKVKYGLKNVHVFPISAYAADGTPTYGTAIKWPGAVSITMDAVGEPENFHADNGVYYVINNNQGYEGDFESALVPDAVKLAVLNYVKDSKGVIVEDSSAELGHFGMAFQFEGDVTETNHILYDCVMSRPNLASKTTEESKEIQTETAKIKSIPLDSGYVKAYTTEETDATVVSNWYTAPQLPTIQ